MKQAVSMLLLGWVDHVAGGLFGLLKGLVLVELFLMIFATYPYFAWIRPSMARAYPPCSWTTARSAENCYRASSIRRWRLCESNCDSKPLFDMIRA